MMQRGVFLLILSVSLWACALAPFPTPTPTPPPATATPSIVDTPTPTIVWFPPTATYTPFPTLVVTPTADMRPVIGDVLFEDDFSSKSGWTVSQTDLGNVAYGKNELAIAIGETNTYLFSMRAEPVFHDFYLEVTASPSLCRGMDEYGVLFRVSPSQAYYRYTLSCNGQIRLDRVSGGGLYASQPWMLSGAVPPGAPSSVRLGISAVGDDLRFFVNGQFQFSVKDSVLPSGGLGFYARSTNNQAVTINFSDLVVYQAGPR